MNGITVYCGNGGDYEFELNRYRWSRWIAENIPGCVPFYNNYNWTEPNTVGFKIVAHSDADKATVYFDDTRNFTLFVLKAPEFIDHE